MLTHGEHPDETSRARSWRPVIDARNAPAKITSVVTLRLYARVGFGNYAITVRQMLAMTDARRAGQRLRDRNNEVTAGRETQTEQTQRSDCRARSRSRSAIRRARSSAGPSATSSNPANVPHAIKNPDLDFVERMKIRQHSRHHGQHVAGYRGDARDDDRSHSKYRHRLSIAAEVGLEAARTVQGSFTAVNARRFAQDEPGHSHKPLNNTLTHP